MSNWKKFKTRATGIRFTASLTMFVLCSTCIGLAVWSSRNDEGSTYAQEIEQETITQTDQNEADFDIETQEMASVQRGEQIQIHKEIAAAEAEVKKAEAEAKAAAEAEAAAKAEEEAAKLKAEKQTAEKAEDSQQEETAQVKADPYTEMVNKAVAAGTGTAGRLVIPSVGVNVALYATDFRNGGGASQAITDAWDSASYVNDGEYAQRIIADHAHQGFSAIRKCAPGTVAYIIHDGSVETLTCTAVSSGCTNAGGDLLWNDGSSVLYSHNAGGLAMYTCNDAEGVSVTVAMWR